MTKRPPARRPAPRITPAPKPVTSPLLLCDHLIALAQEADRAGYPGTAAHLVALVHGMFDEPRPFARV